MILKKKKTKKKQKKKQKKKKTKQNNYYTVNRFQILMHLLKKITTCESRKKTRLV